MHNLILCYHTEPTQSIQTLWALNCRSFFASTDATRIKCPWCRLCRTGYVSRTIVGIVELVGTFSQRIGLGWRIIY